MWGLRGGGGNFGIVTNFEYRLHEVTDIYVEMRFYELSTARSLCSACSATSGRRFPTKPSPRTRERSTVPENEMFPEEMHGKFVAVLLLGYLGDEDDGQAAFAPLRRRAGADRSRWR